MKNLRYLFYGLLFAIVLIKVEAVSWFRIQEMFLFHSFHMYGVLFSAIGVAMVGFQLIKWRNVSLSPANQLPLPNKPLKPTANIAGGLLFGAGWAVTGACPGPVYALIGASVIPAIFVLAGALTGTYVYLKVKNRLPGKP